MPDLHTLGWDDQYEEAFAPHHAAGFVPARVAVQHRGAYDVLTAEGERRVEALPRLVRDSVTIADLPAVGDWVAIEPDGEDRGVIHAVLPRRTKFSRLAASAGDSTDEQVLSANVDVVFIVTSLNEDLNLRRLERYLILAWESGARPVILLTKADLVDDPAALVGEVEAVATGVPVHVVSALRGDGVELVRSEVRAGHTATLLGSSGVGKSTLLNALLDEERMETQGLRADGRGRHTTRRRELTLLPEGGMVIDTPGMRELQLWIGDTGLEGTFDDVTSLFEHCRFNDCAHETEPGCAVQAALADGSLEPERWESYRKLEREIAALERRLDKRAQSDQRRRSKVMTKAYRTRPDKRR